MNAGAGPALAETALVAGAILLPLLAALALCVPHSGLRRTTSRIAPWAALPALAYAAWGTGATLEIPWLMLGARLGLDLTGRVFLGLTAALWLAAGIYARGYLAEGAARRRFFVFFSLSMTGNLGLVMALDAVSFFTFFTLMSFAAYGLVVHERSPRTLRAGKVYMVLVIAGELMLFAALAGLVSSARGLALPLDAADGTPAWVVALLAAGFGIKAGAVPLHVWLPLAHPAAPTPASAVLSGAMIKAGLLGWLRFLPLGAEALPTWGAVFAAVGMLGAFFGVVAGLVQSNPKTVLAYSSVSQMGYLTLAVGAGLAAPHAWPVILPAVLVYSVHHGFAKAALFMGVGAAAATSRRVLVTLLLGVPALSLAGAPLTSGAVSKVLLKTSLGAGALALADWALPLLPLAAGGTSLLMARFLLVTWRGAGVHHPLALSGWIALAGTLGAGVAAVYVLPGATDAAARVLSPASLPGLVAPVLLGAAVSVLAWRLAPPVRALPPALQIPEGDLLVPAARGARRLRLGARLEAIGPSFDKAAVRAKQIANTPLAAAARASGRAETWLESWPVVGVGVLVVVLLLSALYGLALHL